MSDTQIGGRRGILGAGRGTRTGVMHVRAHWCDESEGVTRGTSVTSLTCATTVRVCRMSASAPALSLPLLSLPLTPPPPCFSLSLSLDGWCTHASRTWPFSTSNKAVGSFAIRLMAQFFKSACSDFYIVHVLGRSLFRFLFLYQLTAHIPRRYTCLPTPGIAPVTMPDDLFIFSSPSPTHVHDIIMTVTHACA